MQKMDEMCPRWKLVRDCVVVDSGLGTTCYERALTYKPLRVFVCTWHWLVLDAVKNMQSVSVAERTRAIELFQQKMVRAKSKESFAISWAAFETKEHMDVVAYFTKWVATKEQWAQPWRRESFTFLSETSSLAEASNSSWKAWLDEVSDLPTLVFKSVTHDQQATADEKYRADRNQINMAPAPMLTTEAAKKANQTFSDHVSQFFDKECVQSANYNVSVVEGSGGFEVTRGAAPDEDADDR